MYRENPLKRRLAGDERVLGCWLNMVSPIAAEIVALAGYDCVMIDHEHGPGALLDAMGLMHAVSASGAVPLMRVPWNDAVYVKRALDLGVEGLMFPAISSADEARAAVAATRYPPLGVRGAAYSSVRASDYGLAGECYRDTAADNLMVICQIETVQGVDAIAEIAEVPGVDMLFIGPYDLSASVGRLGRFDDPLVSALIDRAECAILDSASRSGVWYGSIPSPLRTTARLLEVGCRLVIAGSDIGFVRRGALAEVQTFRNLIAGL
ncbi:MAG: aldolase/citrate lyase family protein [Rhodospirillaceae bacterium]